MKGAPSSNNATVPIRATLILLRALYDLKFDQVECSRFRGFCVKSNCICNAIVCTGIDFLLSTV